MSLHLKIFKDEPMRLPRQRLHRLFESIIEEETEPKWRGAVNLVFTDDSYMKKLNKKYRGKRSATDVLSFNIDDAHEHDSLFGEIYVSAATAKRQAREYGGSVSAEYIRLFCHGMLHLIGYDHAKSKDAAHMRSLERHYMSKVGERIPQ